MSLGISEASIKPPALAVRARARNARALFKQTIVFARPVDAGVKGQDERAKKFSVCHPGKGGFLPASPTAIGRRYSKGRNPMGLDMYATLYRAVDAENIQTDIFDEEEVAPLFQWRKHPNLHGWMEQLYRAKGGASKEFNGNSVRLDSADLDALEKAVIEGSLPYTTGFFFGRSQPKHTQYDHDFLKLARSAIANGYAVFYWGSW